MNALTFGGIDEVGGDVTAVELHTLNDLQLIVQSLPILRCEDVLITEHTIKHLYIDTVCCWSLLYLNTHIYPPTCMYIIVKYFVSPSNLKPESDSLYVFTYSAHKADSDSLVTSHNRTTDSVCRF